MQPHSIRIRALALRTSTGDASLAARAHIPRRANIPALLTYTISTQTFVQYYGLLTRDNLQWINSTVVISLMYENERTEVMRSSVLYLLVELLT